MSVSKKGTLKELAEKIKKLKLAGKKIVLCHGCFDLMHPGHIKHFQAAKKLGDILVVTVTPDGYVNKGPGRPVYNEKIRTDSITALDCVDYVALNEWSDAIETIKLLKPDFYVKDQEFEDVAEADDSTAIFNESEVVESVGGKLYLTKELRFSSSRLLNYFFGLQSEEASAFLTQMRQKFTAEKIVSMFDELKRLKVLVIGDAIIDEYHYVNPMGKTPKTNAIAANFLNKESFAGGVMACANHLAGFCNKIDLVTCLGDRDSKEDFIVRHLKKNIKPHFFFRPDSPTVVKRRFVDPAFMGKLFEVYFYDDRPLGRSVEQLVLDHLSRVIASYDLVLVTDFGHGFLTSRIMKMICAEAKFLALNVQTNTGNFGFNLVTKYPRADYICLDEPEVRLASQSKFGELNDITLDVKDKLNSKTVIVTRGHKNTLVCGEQDVLEVPVFSSKIVDTVGAGDAFFSITSPCAALNWPAELLGFIGNVCGGLAVGIVGNKSSVEPEPFFQFLKTLLK